LTLLHSADERSGSTHKAADKQVAIEAARAALDAGVLAQLLANMPASSNSDADALRACLLALLELDHAEVRSIAQRRCSTHHPAQQSE
jgi:hypothetical protein